MADIKVPTKSEFKSLTGRTGMGKVFKRKSDLDAIFSALEKHDHASGMDAQISALRAVRRACIQWVTATFGTNRASSGAVNQLLTQSNQRFLALMEARYAGSQSSSSQVPGANKITAVPNLPFGKELTGSDVKRTGNALQAGLAAERGDRHWGPHVHNKMKALYDRYAATGGSLSMGAWADHVFPANLQDDPGGMYLGGANQASAPSAREISEGVKYCTKEERAAYKLEITAGVVDDVDGDPYDTAGRETHFSGFGWAIFVLGFDNILYSNTHLVNLFHHSSFFAGEPVQCGGEICCIGGKVRYLTPKTGHYRSGKQNFYRMLSFLSYHGVDLNNVLACPEPHVSPMKFWRAADVFSANGGAPSTPPVQTGGPGKLQNAGVPQWPVPPMAL